MKPLVAGFAAGGKEVVANPESGGVKDFEARTERIVMDKGKLSRIVSVLVGKPFDAVMRVFVPYETV